MFRGATSFGWNLCWSNLDSSSTGFTEMFDGNSTASTACPRQFNGAGNTCTKSPTSWKSDMFLRFCFFINPQTKCFATSNRIQKSHLLSSFITGLQVVRPTRRRTLRRTCPPCIRPQFPRQNRPPPTRPMRPLLFQHIVQQGRRQVNFNFCDTNNCHDWISKFQIERNIGPELTNLNTVILHLNLSSLVNPEMISKIKIHRHFIFQIHFD